MALAVWAVVLGPRTTRGLDRTLVQRNGQVVAFERDQWRLTEAELVQLLFGSGDTFNAARELAENGVAHQIETLTRIAELSESQRHKLELAGQGDIDLFVDEAEGFVRSVADTSPSAENFEYISRGVELLRARYRAGLHGEESLFYKTLRSTLDADQFRAVQDVEREHYRDLVERTVIRLERMLKLSPEQQEEFANVVLEKTEPPAFSSTALWNNSSSSVVLRPVLLKMAEIEDDLKPLLDERQWKGLQELLANIRQAEPPMQGRKFIGRGNAGAGVIGVIHVE